MACSPSVQTGAISLAVDPGDNLAARTAGVTSVARFRVNPGTAVIARFKRAIQYAAASVFRSTVREYWIARFRGQ
jgi:hypothetical protein